MLFAQTVVSQPSFFGAPGLLTCAILTGVCLLVSVGLFFMDNLGALFMGPFTFILALITLGVGFDGSAGTTVPKADIAQVYEIPERDLPSKVSASDSPFTLPDGRLLMRSDQRDNDTNPGVHWVVKQ